MKIFVKEMYYIFLHLLVFTSKFTLHVFLWMVLHGLQPHAKQLTNVSLLYFYDYNFVLSVNSYMESKAALLIQICLSVTHAL